MNNISENVTVENLFGKIIGVKCDNCILINYIFISVFATLVAFNLVLFTLYVYVFKTNRERDKEVLN